MQEFRREHKILIVILFVIFAAQALYLMDNKSATTDAVSFHAVNGYAYLNTRDYRMSPAMPPFLRQWMSLPWFFFNPVLSLERLSWQEADSVPFATEFLFIDNRAIALDLIFASRLMMFFWAVVMGLGVACWAKRLYGSSSAVFAVMLFVFSPTILGYSALANVDIGVACFYFLAMYYLWRHSQEKRKRLLCLSGLFFGLVLASKYTGILLIPIYGIYFWRFRGFLRGSALFAALMVLSLTVVWASYFFEFKPLLHNVPRVEEKVGYISRISDFVTRDNAEARDFFIKAAHELPVPLASWILGFAGVARSHRAEYNHFFMGEWTQHGVWYHYIFSFLVKSTLALLILIMLRKITLLNPKEWTDGSQILLFAPVWILFLATFFDSTGVGIRYLVPVYPFIFVWVSGLWKYTQTMRSKRIAQAGLVGLLIFHAASSLAHIPDHLQYFNPLIGGPKNAYKYVRANDLEWGQELKNLGRFAKENDIRYMRHSLFGTHDTDLYHVPGEPMRESDLKKPERIVYAISAVWLDTVEWAGDREPTHRIGNVIFIYDLR